MGGWLHGILLCHVPRVKWMIRPEVFLAALRQLHALRDVSRFAAWLAGHHA